jgi:hypothetical protein
LQFEICPIGGPLFFKASEANLADSEAFEFCGETHKRLRKSAATLAEILQLEAGFLTVAQAAEHLGI